MSTFAFGNRNKKYDEQKARRRIAYYVKKELKRRQGAISSAPEVSEMCDGEESFVDKSASCIELRQETCYYGMRPHVYSTTPVEIEIWAFDMVAFRACVSDFFTSRRQCEADDADFLAGGWVQYKYFMTSEAITIRVRF